MALGMRVGLDPGNLVLNGDTASPPPFLLWTNGWMHEDATWYGGRPQPRDFPLDGDPPPSHGPMSIVAKQLDGSRWHLAWRWALVQATLC